MEAVIDEYDYEGHQWKEIIREKNLVKDDSMAHVEHILSVGEEIAELESKVFFLVNLF